MKHLVLDQSDAVGSWVMAQTGGQWVPGQGQAIGLAREGELVAGVTYCACNGASVYTDIAAVGEGWLNRAFLHAIIWYPFVQLGCRKLIGVVAESNLQSRRFVEHFGFKREATLSDAHPDGALWVYTLARSDCHWMERISRHEQAKGTRTR